MNTSTQNEYLFLFRGNQWNKGMSAEELQRVMGQFMSWFEKLKLEGKLKTGQPLEREGKIVSGKNGRTIADGPFAESKEAVGGYFLLTAGSLDEAVAIAKQCPTLQYGSVIEVRPIAEKCSSLHQATGQLAHTTA